MKKNLRLVYASLLQLEYLIGLLAAYLLGAEDWILFIVCLLLTLGIGFGTTAMYWALMDKTTKR